MRAGEKEKEEEEEEKGKKTRNNGAIIRIRREDHGEDERDEYLYLEATDQRKNEVGGSQDRLQNIPTRSRDMEYKFGVKG